MQPAVPPQLCAAVEYLPALAILMRVLPRMAMQTLGQLSTRDEGLPALVAPAGLVARVHSLVVYEWWAMTEGLSTLFQFLSLSLCAIHRTL